MKLKYIFQLIEASTGKRTQPVSCGALKLAEILSDRTQSDVSKEDYVLLLSVEQITEGSPSDTVPADDFGLMFPLMRVSTFLDFLDDKVSEDFHANTEEK